MSARATFALREHASADPEAAEPRRFRVLLAEDDEPFRTLLAQYLRQHGAEVIEAHSGGALLDALGELVVEAWPRDAVDAIITDIRMPGMSGLDIVTQLRKCGWEMPVVLITAFGDAGTHRQANRLGAEVLDKPFRLQELLTVVERVMAAGRGKGGLGSESGKDPVPFP